MNGTKMTTKRRKTSEETPMQEPMTSENQEITIKLTRNDYTNIMVLIETGAKQIATAQLATPGQESMEKASNILSTSAALQARLKQQVEQ